MEHRWAQCLALGLPIRTPLGLQTYIWISVYVGGSPSPYSQVRRDRNCDDAVCTVPQWHAQDRRRASRGESSAGGHVREETNLSDTEAWLRGGEGPLAWHKLQGHFGALDPWIAAAIRHEGFGQVPQIGGARLVHNALWVRLLVLH